MKFVALISRPAECRQWRDAHSGHEFVFASLSGHGDEILKLGGQHLDAGLQRLQQSHRESRFAGVLTEREKFVRLRHHIESHLGLPNSVEDPERFRDKWLQQQCLMGGRPLRSRCLLRDSGDLEDLPDLEFPVVIKPRFGFNSRSVILIENADELASALRVHQRRFGLMKNEDTDSHDFVIEPYHPGTEHTLECFVQKGLLSGLLISDKDAMQAPYFVESGDLMPTRLGQDQCEELHKVAQRAIDRLGIHHGWAHIEIKRDGDRVNVIEAAARMGGGYFGEMIQRVYGIERMSLLIESYGTHLTDFDFTPHTFIKGQRLVARGLSLLWPKRRLPRKVIEDPHFEWIWPNDPVDIKRLIIGPPYGYKNTILEYFIHHPDYASACRLSELHREQLEPPRMQLPNWLSERIWNFVTAFNRGGRRRKLDL